MNDLLLVSPNSHLFSDLRIPLILLRDRQEDLKGGIVQVLGKDDKSNPQLFISSKKMLNDIDALEKANINVIVSAVACDCESSVYLKPNSDLFYERFEMRTIRPAIPGDIRRFSLASLKFEDDGTNSLEAVRTAFRVYSDVCHEFHGQNILVHCAAGLSRSVLLTASFIAQNAEISLMHAIDEISGSGKTISIDVPLLYCFSQALGIPVEDSHFKLSNFES